MSDEVRAGGVSIAYVEWGAAHRAASLGEILRCVAASRLALREVVIVDNKGDCMALAQPLGCPVRIVAGSNASREFSGWDEAHERLSEPQSLDVLLLGNDTFGIHRRPRFLRRRRIAAWIGHLAQTRAPEAFGQLDPLDAHTLASPFGPIDRYICTYLFGLNGAALARAFPLQRLDSAIAPLLAGGYSPGGLFTPAVAGAYRAKLETWLHRPGEWIKAAPLSRENFEFFKLKAKSILYEHGLTQLLRSGGVAVNDVLSGRGAADSIEAAWTRWWFGRTQAATRELRKARRLWGFARPVANRTPH